MVRWDNGDEVDNLGHRDTYVLKLIGLIFSPGGHVRPDLFNRIPRYIERHGVEAGVEVANFEISHIKAYKDLFEQEGIDCDFIITRNMNVYISDDTAAQAKKIYEELASLGLSYVDDIHYTSGKLAEGVRHHSIS
jgi:hypothetical protein